MNIEFVDVSRLWEQVATIFVDPASNLQAAFVLYGMLLVLLLMITVAAILFILSTSDDEIETVEQGSVAGAAGTTRTPAAPVVPRTPRQRAITAAVVVGCIALAWIATGVATSSTQACDGCHLDTPHSLTTADVDPHYDTGCASCHDEPGLRRFTTAVPARVTHFLEGATEVSLQEQYGQVTQQACRSCHNDDISVVSSGGERGLRMSHEEPLEARAVCLDCHVPDDGIVAVYNAGMAECLRCHDSITASAECTMCHEKSTSVAARAGRSMQPAELIEDIRCSGCHDERNQCDPCHGIRMPHTTQFRAYAHARAGATDFWYNNGETCARCHTQTRNPCTNCHTPMLGTAHPASIALFHQAAADSACDRCHQQYAYLPGRSFCVDLCHSPEALEASPR